MVGVVAAAVEVAVAVAVAVEVEVEVEVGGEYRYSRIIGIGGREGHEGVEAWLRSIGKATQNFRTDRHCFV